MSPDDETGIGLGAGLGSKRLDPQYDLRAAFPDYVDFFEQWRSRSEQARSALRPFLDIPYGPGPRDRLDVFRAPHGDGRLLVFLHGGYWRFMDKSDFSFIAVPYLERGVSVALINYALFPGTSMSAVVDQVCDACVWMAANANRFGIACNELHLAGWSAGAHLATMAACSPTMERRTRGALPHIRTVLAISGIYDLEPLLQTSANADLRLNEAEARRYSPIHMRPAPATRIAVAWGAGETEAFRNQSQALVDAWRKKGVDVTAQETPRLHHYAIMNALGDGGSSVFALSKGLLSLQ
jgi:arylformamidase